MRFAAAIFFALAVVAAQFLHSGLFKSVLAYPAYALVCLGVLCALPSVWALRRQPWAWPTLAGIALAGYALWRCANAPDAVLARTDAMLILACAAMWAGVSLGVTRNKARFVFLVVLLVAAGAQVTVAVIQLVRPGDFAQPYWLSDWLQQTYASRFAFRPRGLFMNPNQFAWLMNALALLTLSLGIWGRLGAVWRIALLYLAVVFAVMTVLSASRGGMVSLAVGFCAFLGLSLAAVVVSVTQRRILLLCVGAVLLAVCASAAYAAFSTSWIAQNRLESLLSADVRTGYVEQAVRLFQTAPVFGAGPGVYKYAARLYRTGDVSNDPVFAHDDWLQFPAEYGFVGLAILVVLTVTALVAGSRGFLALVRVASSETESALSSSGAFVLDATCALVTAAVHGNVDFNMHVPANALLAAALLGLVTGVRPAEFERGKSRLRPVAWLTATAALAAACVLGTILVQRGEGDYRALQAENFLLRNELKLAGETADKGLALLPDDPWLLALRARVLYEYEAWLQATTPAKIVRDPVAEAEAAAESDGGEGDDVFFNEEPEVLLSPEESEKNFRDSAEILERLVKMQPMERQHYTALARAYLALGRKDDPRRKYVETVGLDPMQASPWAAYGEFLLELERPLDARRIFEIGAQLPGGSYSRAQMESIDDDLLFEKELQQEEAASQ